MHRFTLEHVVKLVVCTYMQRASGDVLQSGLCLLLVCWLSFWNVGIYRSTSIQYVYTPTAGVPTSAVFFPSLVWFWE